MNQSVVVSEISGFITLLTIIHIYTFFLTRINKVIKKDYKLKCTGTDFTDHH